MTPGREKNIQPGDTNVTPGREEELSKEEIKAIKTKIFKGVFK